MSNLQLKILHIEDDEGDAKALQRAFAKEFPNEGCIIIRVKSIKEALREIQKNSFNAIILDLGLEDIQGMDNVRVIKGENPELPIVVLSGHDSNAIALQAVREGAQEYVVKGYSTDRMLGLSVLYSIERKTYERQLFKQAYHDDLTGLPNRRMFTEYMQRFMIRANRRKCSETVMFMDVNGFKGVNDMFGHDVGNVLLEQIAARLKVGFRASDMVARYGGDEFIVHLDTDNQPLKEICTQLVDKISDMFAQPIKIGSHDITTSLSIGIATYPYHGKDTIELIRSADQAMYKAKKEGLRFAFAE